MRELRNLEDCSVSSASRECNVINSGCNRTEVKRTQCGKFDNIDIPTNNVNFRCEVNNYAKNNCNSKCDNITLTGLNGYSLAMVYSPHQSFDDLYEFEEGFCNGTLFKKLNFPFYMASCRGVKNSTADCGCEKCQGGR